MRAQEAGGRTEVWDVGSLDLVDKLLCLVELEGRHGSDAAVLRCLLVLIHVNLACHASHLPWNFFHARRTPGISAHEMSATGMTHSSVHLQSLAAEPFGGASEDAMEERKTFQAGQFERRGGRRGGEVGKLGTLTNSH